MPRENISLEPVENEKDEQDILANQDGTDPGDINVGDEVMGAGSTDEMPLGADAGDFARGEVDVVEQMNRTKKQMEHPRG